MSKAESKNAESMDAMWGGDAEGQPEGASRLQWLRDSKYSMFIHWGLYSHLGGEYRGKTYHGIGEWIMHPAMADIPPEDYMALAKEFNPVKFDAKAIVDLAKRAGMRCIVVTAKHHEGFAMFDSKASDFSITRATPFGRDPMKELADACAEAGIRLGFYYSQFQDWVEPDAGHSPDFADYFKRKALPQITELLTNYGPIAIVWFDTPGSMSKEDSQKLVDHVHALQPDCLINSRVGNGLGDYSSFGDMEIPVKNPDKDKLYECIATTNDSWSWSRSDSHWKSPTTIIQQLVRSIARGCCFMLNMGPKDDGSVPKEAALALTRAGEWVATHSEAVYKTSASPFPRPCWGDFTVKGRKLFLHIFQWPTNGKLQIAALEGRVNKAVIMDGDLPVAFLQREDHLLLTLPQTRPSDCLVPVICLTLDSPPQAHHQNHLVDGDSRVALLAEYAETDTVLKRESWMEAFGDWHHLHCLTGWTGPDSTASWPLQVLAPGTYSVQVEYACGLEGDGTEWEVTTAEDTITFLTFDTGQRQKVEGRRLRMRFRTVEVGLLHFAKTGHQKLRLRPSSSVPEGPLAIAQLSFLPWR